MTRDTSPAFTELELLGGNLCLDFANTVDHDRASTTRHEYLTDVQSLIDWARHARIIDQETATSLHAVSTIEPDAADDVFGRALSLRQAVQRVFTAVAQSSEPETSDIARIQSEYLQAIGSGRFVRVDAGFDWSYDDQHVSIDRVLAPVAVAALDLLRSGPLHRIKRCPGDDDQCGWLFLDTSRNGSRRWCSMKTCGSRDKMRRMYRRTKLRGRNAMEART